MRINLLALVLAVAVLIGVTSIARAEERTIDVTGVSARHTFVAVLTVECLGDPWCIGSSLTGFFLGEEIASIDDFPPGPGFTAVSGDPFDNLFFIDDPVSPISIFGFHFITRRPGGERDESLIYRDGVDCFICLKTSAPGFGGVVSEFGVPLTLTFTERGGTMPPIPEPEIMALMLAGLGMISFITRRRNFARV